MLVKYKTNHTKKGWDTGDLIKFSRSPSGSSPLVIKIKSSTRFEEVPVDNIIAICPYVGYRLEPNKLWDIPFYMGFIPNYKFRKTRKGVMQAKI